MENFSQICFQESPPPLIFQRPLHNNKNKRFLFFYNFVKLSEAFGKHDLLVIENVGEIIFKYVSEKAPSLIFQRSLYNKPFLFYDFVHNAYCNALSEAFEKHDLFVIGDV